MDLGLDAIERRNYELMSSLLKRTCLSAESALTGRPNVESVPLGAKLPMIPGSNLVLHTTELGNNVSWTQDNHVQSTIRLISYVLNYILASSQGPITVPVSKYSIIIWFKTVNQFRFSSTYHSATLTAHFQVMLTCKANTIVCMIRIWRNFSNIARIF